MFIMNPKYKVKRGDTLSGIAAKTGFTVAEISAANGIENPDLIYAGAVIDLPLYTVDSKKDVHELAKYFGKGYRSVISKLVQLKIYEKPEIDNEDKGLTVKVMLRELEEILEISIEGTNLNKKENLSNLLDAIKRSL